MQTVFIGIRNAQGNQIIAAMDAPECFTLDDSISPAGFLIRMLVDADARKRHRLRDLPEPGALPSSQGLTLSRLDWGGRDAGSRLLASAMIVEVADADSAAHHAIVNAVTDLVADLPGGNGVEWIVYGRDVDALITATRRAIAN